MKLYIELALVALLLVLVQRRSGKGHHLHIDALGKALLVGAVVIITQTAGTNAGLIAAVTAIVLLTRRGGAREGFGTGGSGSVRATLTKQEQEAAGFPGGATDSAAPPWVGGKPTSKKCASDVDCGHCYNKCTSGSCVMNMAGGFQKATGNSCKTGRDCSPCQNSCGPDGVCVISAIDQVSLDRQIKRNGVEAFLAASQQANGQTNNAVEGSAEQFGNYF